MSSGDPLITRKNPFGENALVFFEGRDKPITPCKKTGEMILNGVSAVLVVSNKLPFIPIALRIPYMGIPVAMGMFVGFGTLEFWAFRAISSPFVETEKEGVVPISKSSQALRRMCIVGTSYGIALGAQIPISLSAAKYDPKDWKVVGFLVSEVVGAFIPALSLKMAFENNLPRKYKEETERKLYGIYLHAKKLVSGNRQRLIDMGYARQLAFIQEVEAIKEGQGDRALKISAYASKFLNEEGSLIEVESCCRKSFSYPVRLTGVVLATSFLYATGRYSFDVSSAMFGSQVALRATFATVGVLSNAFIMYAALDETLMKAYRGLCSLLTRSSKPSLADQIRPKLSFAIKSGLFIADALGVGIIYQIWKDYFSGDQTQQTYFITVNCLSLFLLLFTAALDTTDDVIYMLQRGSDPNDFHTKLVELNDIFKKIEDQLLNCPLSTFASFLNELPADLKDRLLERFTLTQDALSGYLQIQTPLQVSRK